MSLNRNLFKQYPNKVFVETGSYRGDAIRYALSAKCFERIISIDIEKQYTDFCYQRFDLKNSGLPVELVTGDSALILWDVIKDINEPITFWLDSHWQMLSQEDRGDNPFPLLEELRQIKKHHIKTHKILIDDMLIMQNNITGYNQTKVLETLFGINKNYCISYFDNPVINGILGAEVKTGEEMQERAIEANNHYDFATRNIK